MALNIRARLTPFCWPRPSKAPAFTSASTTLRFTLRPSTRLQKSNIDSSGPPCSRAALITSTAPSPTPFTAPRPNRITLLSETEGTEETEETDRVGEGELRSPDPFAGGSGTLPGSPKQ